MEKVLERLEKQSGEMAETLSKMIQIESYSPILGGPGESKRADYLMTLLKGFDEVKRYDIPHDGKPEIARSSILAKKHGKKKGTFWIVSHIDTVAPGILEKWKYPPFSGTIKDGNVYGRGAEDDGEAVIASIFAAKEFLDKNFEGMSLGLALVADEELGSGHGIVKLVEMNCFSEEDFIFVPDTATENNDKIEVVEKNILWPTIKITGAAAHASTPEDGINPHVPGLEIIRRILDLKKKYDKEDSRFPNKKTTIEFTKIVSPTAGINAIPETSEFSFDIRTIPCYDPMEVEKDIENIVADVSKTTKAKIEVSFNYTPTGKGSPEDGLLYRELKKSIENVLYNKVESIGASGGTCAAPFRLKGIPAYGWVMYNNTLHRVNEFVPIEHIVIDAKIMASMIYNICLNSQKDD